MTANELEDSRHFALRVQRRERLFDAAAKRKKLEETVGTPYSRRLRKEKLEVVATLEKSESEPSQEILTTSFAMNELSLFAKRQRDHYPKDGSYRESSSSDSPHDE